MITAKTHYPSIPTAHFRAVLRDTLIPVIPTLALYKMLHKRYLSGSILLLYTRPYASNSILKPYNMLPETMLAVILLGRFQFRTI